MDKEQKMGKPKAEICITPYIHWGTKVEMVEMVTPATIASMEEIIEEGQKAGRKLVENH